MVSMSSVPSAANPTSASALQAVFWDMDGTLVDTEPYWIAAEYELVESYGGTWTEDQAHQLVGQALTYSASVLQDAGVAMESGEIIDWLITRVAARARESMPWRPGARELLGGLHTAGIRSALVTMSHQPLAQAVVEALPAGQMEFIVTGDMVSQGKPDPEAYHLAFDRMAESHPARAGEQLSRARCIAIEDSVPGTAAAAASGLVTVAVPHFTPLPESGQWHLLPTLSGVNAAHLEDLLPGAVPAV